MASILKQVENAAGKVGDIADNVGDAINIGGVFGKGRQSGKNYFDEWVAHLDSVPRTNRYLCEITAPPMMLTNPMYEFGEGSVSDDLRRINVFMESIQMPGKNIRTVSNETVYGPTYEVAQGLTYAEEIAITFFMRNDHKERLFFNAWQDLIINPKTYNLSYYKDYISKMRVFQLDENNNKVAGIEITEIFPKTVNAIDYNVSTTNEFARGSVGLAFKEWIPLQGSGENWKPYEQYIEDRNFDTRPVRRKGLFEDLGRTFNKVIEARNAVVGVQQKVNAFKNFFGGLTKNPVSNLGIGRFF
jgi:hypothetical protein